MGLRLCTLYPTAKPQDPPSRENLEFLNHSGPTLQQTFRAQLTSLGDDFTLSSLSTLVWNLTNYDTVHVWNDLNRNPEFIPALLSIFCNVTHLKICNPELKHYSGLVSQCLTHLPKVTYFSCVTSPVSWESTQILHGLLTLPQLTRLEFNLSQGWGGDGVWEFWDRVLAKVAATLEHVTIRRVRQVGIGARIEPCFTLLVPVLRRLKVFQIFVAGWNGRVLRERRKLELGLHFVPAFPEQGLVLNYATQFPALVRLEVGEEKGSSLFEEKIYSRDEEEGWFETCLPFLSETFLPPLEWMEEPCTSLRVLMFPSPKEQEYRLGSEQGLSAIRSLEFYERLKNVFPNCQNLGRYGP